MAWTLVLSSLFTAGLLREFHEDTPRSPWISPIVGSLLFAALLFVLLVAAREWRRGPTPGAGIRLGSLTPLMLMLLIEKWASLTLYEPVFYALAPRATEARLDAYFTVFAGAALLVLCVLLARLSAPARRATWRRVRLPRWPAALAGTALVVGGCYLILALLAGLLGGRLQLQWPPVDAVLPWTLGGQVLLAVSEEVYYRGLVLAELMRLGPRLGLSSTGGRRWFALLGSAALFGMEHVRLDVPWTEIGRHVVFTVSLGLLFGILVLVTENLAFVASIHVWINALLLSAAPRLVDVVGQPALPPGTYIGVTLILAFVGAFFAATRRGRGPS